MTLRRSPIPSPNYSGRGGALVRLIVLHTAEGARTFGELGNFFANPASGVSSHVGIDDTPGVIGEYVRPEHKAWTQADANPYSVAAELCAFASWDAHEWQRHPAMIENVGRWIGEEAARFAIPLRVLTPAEAQGGAAGVCQHVDLGASGGGHWDCGPSFPMSWAMGYAGPPAPAQQEVTDNMIASTSTGEGYWTATHDGAVYAFGDAQYKGNAMGHVTGKVVGIAGRSNNGYWLLASDGGVFAFGSAAYEGGPDRV